MKNATHLSRMQLRAVQGGVSKDPCANKTGAELQNCQFNVCMAGWDSSTHTPAQNKDKADGCDKATQPAT
ncbi:hypothetical protein [Pedobacter sp. KLB.chiD]|uniref:hypothetical protein n=1 Tax=Pedobacter sp. KLB.chiD TaxID=3387402 RepID=UPI00399AACE3